MWGTPTVESWLVPRGEVVVYEDSILVHPRDMLIMRMGKNLLPFESRMNLGMRELERDRRRHG